MRLEALTVALRPRSAWEAAELGMALVRRHAGAIWKPWLLTSLPLLVALNAVGWALDLLWLAGLLMWWLKPWFDRIPLFVLSRAVFGETPDTRQTVRAALRWGARWWLPYLTWRRLGPARSLYLPVDLLEGGSGSEARHRRGALGAPVYGVGSLLTLTCVHFEIVIVLGALLGALMFVPFDYLPDTFKALFEAVAAQPQWFDATLNGLAWLATALIEPFYVGAGFGLYLNRRTEIEGWDIEIVFRRLRARLTAAAAPLLLVLCAMVGFAPDAAAQAADASSAAQAQAAAAVEEEAAGDETVGEAAAEAAAEETASDEESAPPYAPIRDYVDDSRKSRRLPSTLGEVFGEDRRDDRALREAVAKAMQDPTVSPKRTQTVWKPKAERKDQEKERKPSSLEMFDGLGGNLAAVVQWLLWGVVAAIAIALLWSASRWLGWFRGGEEEEPSPGEVRVGAAAEPEPLPDDIPTAIRRLWRAGRARDALALMYRAAVESMAQRADIVLVPGATEAQCLRASRKLALADDREAFARAVRTWQYAAYADVLPDDEEFDDLVGLLGRRFGWTA
ncbi:hypothetical protein [Lysobacter antibioticus]|uniref:hypothetical protein n=1 Tax=Lysobacter antibioticus TaxID=84531 RepID=UPI0003493412|nr:hypothetical protein [Lysobacter antibioticus]